MARYHRSMAAIGVFDSGVGGLSVLAAVRKRLPGANLIYVADSAHVPYGPRALQEVRDFSFGITQFLVAQGAQVVVAACNTASAAALHELRAAYPDTPFVGMEPAVKPAAEHSHTGVVAVLATQATFQGALFASVVERFAQGVEVIPQVCPGLVEQIEAGELGTPRTEAMLRNWVDPLLARNIDALVLGCTHYPFVRPLLERICGPTVRVIDPSAAVARQVERVLSTAKGAAGSATREQGAVTYFTSGAVAAFELALSSLGSPEGSTAGVKWTSPSRLCPA
ncbi:MAG: glutamate racemase [Caldilineaceae bacterium]